MPPRGHRDDVCPLPLRQLHREVTHSTSGPVDQHGHPWRDRHRLVHLAGERRRHVVAEINQVLPGRQHGHRRPGRLNVVDTGRLVTQVRSRRGHVLGVRPAVESREPQHAEDLVTDGEPGHVRSDRLDHARHVRSGDEGELQHRPHLGRHDLHPLTQVPVRRVDAHRVHPHEHLARTDLGNRHLVVPQNFRPAGLVELDRLHRACRFLWETLLLQSRPRTAWPSKTPPATGHPETA